jgi:hypothetical protein
VRGLGEANLDLDLAHGEVALVGDDLSFERLKNESLLSIGV